MQAIILAAGMGRRLGKYTRDNTKCMVSVNGERLIDRLLGQLSRLGLNRVVIVVGYKGKELREYVGNRYDDRLLIEWAENPIYDRTNNIYSLWLVRRQLEADDTLLIESDLIFDDALFDMVLANPYPNLALVAKYEPWMDGTMVRIDGDCNIVNFVPKSAFSYDEVGSYYKTVNIYKFGREFSSSVYVPFLDAYCKVMGNNEYYEQVLRVITLLDRTGLKALPIGDERWYEIDDEQDLDNAETIFAEPADRLERYSRRYGGYWRFSKLLDYCYLVNPYFPPQKLRDELRAAFDSLLTHYPSGMAVNRLLAGKYFGISRDHVVVGNGAAELIKSLMSLREGKVGIVYPTFEEYPNRLPEERIVAFTPQDADLRYSVDDLMAHYGEHPVDTLLLVNPDNPSGNYVTRDDVERLALWCAERGTMLVVDESFVDFADTDGAKSLLDDALLESHPGMVVVKSISKSYGVPGLRLGVLASADRDLVERVSRDVAIWNINSIAEYYMQVYNKYQKDYVVACEKFAAERRRFAGRLAAVRWLEVLPSQANYFLCRVKGMSSTTLTRRLLAEYNILIKDCEHKTGLAGLNMVRIAIRDDKDNDTLVNALMQLGQ